MSIYRYRLDLINATKLARKVSGTAPTLSAASPNFVDISYTGTKADLDEVMAEQGFAYVSTTPSDTPSQAVATQLGISSSFDVRDTLAFDHFLVGSNTTERIGLMGWQTLIGGTGASLSVTGETGHPGIIDLNAGTSASGRTAIYLGDSTFKEMAVGSTQGQIDMEWLVDFSSTSLSATNNEMASVGLGDAWDGAAGVSNPNCICCEFNPSVSANFRLMTSAASTATRTTTSIAVAASTWYRIGLQMTYPGGVATAKLFINGIERASHTTNIPTVNIGPGIRIDANVTSNAPHIRADYMKLTQITNKET